MYGHVYGHVYGPVYGHVCRHVYDMYIDMCIDMGVGMCTDMCIDMCMNMCIMCTDLRADTNDEGGRARIHLPPLALFVVCGTPALCQNTASCQTLLTTQCQHYFSAKSISVPTLLEH